MYSCHFSHRRRSFSKEYATAFLAPDPPLPALPRTVNGQKLLPTGCAADIFAALGVIRSLIYPGENGSKKRGLRVPVYRRNREDLHSLNRVSTPTGQGTYRAPRRADGHADRCSALTLALRATNGGIARLCSESVKALEGVGNMGLARFRPDRWPL
jgi:hypothetical protein